MTDAARITPATAKERVDAGQALLVCAYDDDEKCREKALAGAIPLSKLERQKGELDREWELIFYCS